MAGRRGFLTGRLVSLAVGSDGNLYFVTQAPINVIGVAPLPLSNSSGFSVLVPQGVFVRANYLTAATIPVPEPSHILLCCSAATAAVVGFVRRRTALRWIGLGLF
jgi:hypothetical protein